MSNIVNLSNLTLCELKNLLYKNNKEKTLDKKTIAIINELIDYKIKKSRIVEADPIKKITNLLIKNNINNNNINNINNSNTTDSESDESIEDNTYSGHNKIKNSKKVRNDEFTQTSQKLLNRLIGEASFRYQDMNKIIKPYSTQDKEINESLGKRKNIF